MLTSSESPSSCSSPAAALSKRVPSSLMINLKSLTGTGISVHCSGAGRIRNKLYHIKETMSQYLEINTLRFYLGSSRRISDP